MYKGHSVQSTQCTQYTVYTVHTVHITHCTQYTVYCTVLCTVKPHLLASQHPFRGHGGVDVAVRKEGGMLGWSVGGGGGDGGGEGGGRGVSQLVHPMSLALHFIQ